MRLPSRREALTRCGTGLGMLALAGVFADESRGEPGRSPDPLAPRKPHFPAKAKHVVHLFMNGGPSQVDTFDPKPTLDTLHGKPLPTTNLRTERKTGAAMRSPYKFKKYGQSGIEVSELFAKTAAHVDRMAVIRSLHADVPNHEPSLLLMNCGDGRQPRPSLGSWVTYGLGSENRNLPGFVVMCPGGYPIVTTQNWRSAFLPGVYQGTYVDTQHTQPDKLVAHEYEIVLGHRFLLTAHDGVGPSPREAPFRRRDTSSYLAGGTDFVLWAICDWLVDGRAGRL